MRPNIRLLPRTALLLTALTGALILITPQTVFGQLSSSIARKTIDGMLSPATGSKALERSCRRISAAIELYVNSHKKENWEEQALVGELDDISKLEAKINELDNAENIDSFMRHTLEYLIRHPESPTFAQRLWKLAAITELRERTDTARLLNKPFLPALLNACSMLPPDNPFNLEGRFLAARHYRYKGQPEKEEPLLRDLLKRPRLTPEAKYTVETLLGDFLESQGRFKEAISLYSNASKELQGLPQSIDMQIRGVLLQLEGGNKDQALKLVQELKTPKADLLDLTIAPKISKCLIRLAADGSSFGTVAIAGGGVLILVIIGSLFFLRGRNSNKQYNTMQMNQMGQQNYRMVQQQPVQQQNYAAVTQNQSYPQQPVVQADPAREYYQNLVNQGYPHENAVAYTQQYFPGFMG